MQYHKFENGNYVLHKVVVNGHKYSVWYGKDGNPFSAERVITIGRTANVPARQVNVWAQFKKIGARYVNL